jgi:hypothetical protein
METQHNGMQDRDDSQTNRMDLKHEDNTVQLSDNKDLSGNEISEEQRKERHRYQEHNGRKYKMFSNHSSANDQPFTRTDTTP